MKKIITLATLVATTVTSQASLILTGVIDGPLSGRTPKAIELYATADITDLSQYGIELVSNDSSTSGAIETNFVGSLGAGEYYEVAPENGANELLVDLLV